MKRFMCFLLALCLSVPVFAVASAGENKNQDYYDASIRAWIAYQPIAMMLVSLPDTQPEGIHLLWDIPFGIGIDELVKKAKSNSNIDIAVTSYPTKDGGKGKAHLAIDTSDSVSLFGYNIIHSYFGVIKNTQSVGLTANSTSGNSDLSYVYASLLLLGGDMQNKPSDVMSCVEKITSEVSGIFGKYTKVLFTNSNEEKNVVMDDGSIDYNKITSICNETDKPGMFINFLSIYWGNVKLYTDFCAGTVSLSFYPEIQ